LALERHTLPLDHGHQVHAQLQGLQVELLHVFSFRGQNVDQKPVFVVASATSKGRSSHPIPYKERKGRPRSMSWASPELPPSCSRWGPFGLEVCQVLDLPKNRVT